LVSRSSAMRLRFESLFEYSFLLSTVNSPVTG
jgi:hypothetical protein